MHRCLPWTCPLWWTTPLPADQIHITYTSSTQTVHPHFNHKYYYIIYMSSTQTAHPHINHKYYYITYMSSTQTAHPHINHKYYYITYMSSTQTAHPHINHKYYWNLLHVRTSQNIPLDLLKKYFRPTFVFFCPVELSRWSVWQFSQIESKQKFILEFQLQGLLYQGRQTSCSTDLQQNSDQFPPAEDRPAGWLGVLGLAQTSVQFLPPVRPHTLISNTLYTACISSLISHPQIQITHTHIKHTHNQSINQSIMIFRLA